MRSLFGALTIRGRAFLVAGVTAALLGLGLGQRALLSLGGLLVILPLLSALAARRARYRIQCRRELTPARIPAGQVAKVSIEVANPSRLPTGLLLAEDTLAYSLGTRPRFVLDRIEPGGKRRLSYPIRPDQRGKYLVGPLRIHVADTFGLVRVGDLAAAPAAALVVTPPITALRRAALTGTWLGEGGTRTSTASAAGEDDVVPREYRDGDELRRVHWRSTARYGELMVRREEQRWRNRAVVFLDTRGSAHAGRGPSSSFEFAVAAAASIGVHLAGEGIDGEFLTDAGPASHPGSFEDALLETLAVVSPSRNATLSAGLAHLPARGSGLLVAILGQLSAGQARELAAHRSGSPAIALLLAVATWSMGLPSAAEPAGTSPAARILTAAGWRVATVTAGMPLGKAWDAVSLSRPGAFASWTGGGPGQAVRAAAGREADGAGGPR
jgi:uncharacterized protein (DUF58 family)